MEKSIQFISYRKVVLEEIPKELKINSPNAVANFLTDQIGSMEKEYMVLMLLNTANEVTHYHVVSIGSLSSAIVHPREVYKTAVRECASSIIIGHNHPSGQTYPSPEDEKTTKRLDEAGHILGIKLLDHLIVSGDKSEYFSFKEAGLL